MGVPAGDKLLYSYDEVINSEEYRDDAGIITVKPVYYAVLAEKSLEEAEETNSSKLYSEVGSDFLKVSQYYNDLESYYQDKRIESFFSIVGQAFFQALINVNLGGSTYFISGSKVNYGSFAENAKNNSIYYKGLADECFEKAKKSEG